MKNTNEKADNILVPFAATENQKGFSDITHYTDVFVLLCFIIWLRNLDHCSRLIFTLQRWFIEYILPNVS